MASELIKRFHAETPKFFKKVRAIAVAVGSLSAIIATSGLAMSDSVLFYVTQIGAFSGLIVAFIASLTTKNGVDESGNIIKPEVSLDTINPDLKPNPPQKEPK